MYVIGLTGGIASGKSTAAETLRTLGAHVIDADAISRSLTMPRGKAAHAIMEEFGTLDRKTLAAIVFGDARARQRLNDIVHPMVQAEMEAEMATATSPVVVLDVPLLYESGMEGMADEVWVVHVPKAEQVRRIMARDGLTEEEALARINSQMPTRDKLKRADEAIDTSGSFAQTRMQIENLWHEVLEKTGSNVIPISPYAPPGSTIPRTNSRRTQHRQVAQPAPTPRPAPRPAPPPRSLPMRVLRPQQEPRYASQQEGAWDDTSTLVDMPPQRTFFSRQSPVFWIAAGVLLLVLMIVVGIITINAWRDGEATRAAERLEQQLADEKARYKFLYRDIIEANAVEQVVHPAFIAAVIYNESRFDPQAVSYLGARGLMQIMEDTGGWIAGKFDDMGDYTFDMMFDPATNIRFGVWYLGFLSRTFSGDIVKVTAAYHAGQNAVASWLENPEYSPDGKKLTKIPYPDTEQYVQRVVNTFEIYKKHYYPETEEAAEGSAS